MGTYRELFQAEEFTPLFLSISVRVAATTVQSLALATLVYAATGSPLLSALSMFGSSFAQVIGAFTLLSLADRFPPRAALTGLGLALALATLVMAIRGLPIWAILLVVAATGLANSAGGGIQWGLVNEIVPVGEYVLGRSVFNMAVGIMQIVGFALGGAVLTVLSARGALLVAGAGFVISSLIARYGLSGRPPRAIGRPSLHETGRVNRLLWSESTRRCVYLAQWVPNGLIVGCEALYIPFDPNAAGVLFVAAAFGMLIGDTTMGRFVPAPWRSRLITPMQLLLAVPYLLFALGLPLADAAVAVTVASVGYSASLPLQDRLVASTPAEFRGQSLGLNSVGMSTMQAVGATLAGLLAQQVGAALAMSVMAAASVAVTALLRPRLATLTVDPRGADAAC